MGAGELKYSKDHVGVAVEGDLARLGTADHAQRELGELVFLDLPEVGRKGAQGEIVGSIESVKTTNDLFTPLSSEVIGGQRRGPGQAGHGELGSPGPGLALPPAPELSGQAEEAHGRPGLRRVRQGLSRHDGTTTSGGIP
jgi:hypothetical protein